MSVRVAKMRFKNFSILNHLKFALTSINHLSLQSLSEEEIKKLVNRKMIDGCYFKLCNNGKEF